MCNFIPDYMVRDIIASKNTEQKTKALFRSMLAGVRPQTTGKLINSVAGVACDPDRGPKVKRTVYDADHNTQLPGRAVRLEGDGAIGDKAADDAYDFSGHTYNFFKKIFGRDSLDDNGFHLHSTVHYGHKYCNAFYNSRQICFGDGDGDIFHNFCILDVLGHEWSHGIVEKTCGLVYAHQPGALNESLADVFGSMIKQWVQNQKVDEASWTIGEGLFTKKIEGAIGIRSLKDPGSAYNSPIIGKDRQGKHMDQYIPGDDDSGQVHGNSGIPNHSFYLAATNIGGFAWDKVGKIWYHTMTTKLTPRSQFQDFADATIQSAIKLYGTNIEYKAVKEAWKQVGIIIK